MYALVEILGKQYKAEEGKELVVDKLSMEEGSSYEIEKVLAVVDGDVAKFGAPYVEGAKVTATVGSEFMGEKVKVYTRRSKAKEGEKWHIRKVADHPATDAIPTRSALASRDSAARL